MSNNKNKFLCVTQNFFKCFLKISESKYSDNSGWQIVSLIKKPKYGFVFGSATIGHNGKIVNGDSHSCMQLSGDRYLLSIADGKGHGTMAEKTSNLTISLIEKFFKANISTQTVVTSVNQILSFNSNENFSAVDICIVDQNNGRADFVKLGSTPTLIKRGEKVRIISGSGLPIGVSKMATAFYESEFLSVGDIVIMTSDGVFDGFDSPENFAGFVNNLQLLNMDMLAKCLLEESIKLNGGKIKDDLTVVAFRWLVDY
jgi:stage II sporulation protein E